MTITIGRKFLLAALMLVLATAAAAGGYVVGRSSGPDVAGVRANAYSRGRASGMASGRGAGYTEGLKAAKPTRSDEIGNEIDFLGYTDWKRDHWYVVHIMKRDGAFSQPIYSVNERQLMDGALNYSSCGKSLASLCWAAG